MNKSLWRMIIVILAGILPLISVHAEVGGDLTEQAVSADTAVAKNACAALRAEGPAGLQKLETRYAAEIAEHGKGGKAPGSWKEISAALNAVGGQYDNAASGLYWYTDFEQAKQAAAASDKPILSLRLLGRLDMDLSCANSRFFRTTLYPNAQVSALLRDRFILHWESVRPVPVVTMDFGDGRKLVRTITGNSIHYVLTPQGEIIDALPGLYAADTFAKELTTVADIWKKGEASLDGAQAATQKRLLMAWASDLAATKGPSVEILAAKSEVLEKETDDARWRVMANLHAKEAALDNASLKVVAGKYPSAATAARVTISKMVVEDPLLKALRNLQTTIGVDTLRNNYLLRTKILAFLLSDKAKNLTLAQVNNWVYSDVFLTPMNDPWLGLDAPGVFSGIDGNGESR